MIVVVCTAGSSRFIELAAQASSRMVLWPVRACWIRIRGPVIMLLNEMMAIAVLRERTSLEQVRLFDNVWRLKCPVKWLRPHLFQVGSSEV